ncbi:hypothetical protein AB6A40_009059 [Gnathostoma spinigerum]|uniref:1-alkyl-2-acetylglycerophosphocholine esterase n=1 Tax=Gnathostoma spinigerum TaxID=75299 RepID=A0ABD6F0V8_9BILA
MGGLVSLSWLGDDRSSLPLVGRGRYAVGCADLMVDDGQEGDSGVFARIFYPAVEEQNSDTERPLWVPRSEYIYGLASYRKVSPKKYNFLFAWLVGEKRIAAGWQKPLFVQSDDQMRFPLVVYSHGLSSCRLFQSAFCSSLASHGFIVAAVEHRDRSACWTYTVQKDSSTENAVEQPINMRFLTSEDNEFEIRNSQLHKRVSECVKLLGILEEINMGDFCGVRSSSVGSNLILGDDFDWSQFKGRIDLRQTSIIGHSFGGATALAASASSSDITCAVVIDGWMFPIEKDIYNQIQRPALFLNAAGFQWATNVRSMLEIGGERNKNVLLTFGDTMHASFTDFSLAIPTLFARCFGLCGKTDPYRCMEATVEICVKFLKKEFGGSSEEFWNAVRNYDDFVSQGTNLKLT